jgi:hypothetical protein
MSRVLRSNAGRSYEVKVCSPFQPCSQEGTQRKRPRLIESWDARQTALAPGTARLYNLIVAIARGELAFLPACLPRENVTKKYDSMSWPLYTTPMPPPPILWRMGWDSVCRMECRGHCHLRGNCGTDSKANKKPSTTRNGYRSLAYSALACFRMGMSGSASFH